jgi:hypothetical protein
MEVINESTKYSANHEVLDDDNMISIDGSREAKKRKTTISMSKKGFV